MTASTTFEINPPASTSDLGDAHTEEEAISVSATIASTTFNVASECQGFSTPMIYFTAYIGIPSKCQTTSILIQLWAAGYVVEDGNPSQEIVNYSGSLLCPFHAPIPM